MIGKTKNTYRYWLIGADKYYLFKNFRVYLAYREYVNEYLHDIDYNSSFIGKFFKSGFPNENLCCSSKKPIYPKNNWFGVSVYNPDLVIKKGTKILIMSLQRFLTPLEGFIKHKELSKNMGLRYVCMREAENVVYETYTGEIPSDEILNNFLK